MRGQGGLEGRIAWSTFRQKPGSGEQGSHQQAEKNAHAAARQGEQSANTLRVAEIGAGKRCSGYAAKLRQRCENAQQPAQRDRAAMDQAQMGRSEIGQSESGQARDPGQRPGVQSGEGQSRQARARRGGARAAGKCRPPAT